MIIEGWKYLRFVCFIMSLHVSELSRQTIPSEDKLKEAFCFAIHHPWMKCVVNSLDEGRMRHSLRMGVSHET